jgi:hypothetical protein
MKLTPLLRRYGLVSNCFNLYVRSSIYGTVEDALLRHVTLPAFEMMAAEAVFSE